MTIKDFYEKGYCIIDNFLSDNEAADILALVKKQTEWFEVRQERLHYKEGGPFVTESKYMPGSDEIYSQTSHRAKFLEKEEMWRDIYKTKFVPRLEKFFDCKILKDTTYIIKYEKNDYSRVHTDDLRGEVARVDIGLLYYLCDKWIWDWGGLLVVAESGKSDEMTAILPRHNRVILLNHQKKCPHFVSAVTPYAQNNRFSVASFIGCDKELAVLGKK